MYFVILWSYLVMGRRFIDSGYIAVFTMDLAPLPYFMAYCVEISGIALLRASNFSFLALLFSVLYLEHANAQHQQSKICSSRHLF